MCIVCKVDNLHEMWSLIFFEKVKKKKKKKNQNIVCCGCD